MTEREPPARSPARSQAPPTHGWAPGAWRIALDPGFSALPGDDRCDADILQESEQRYRSLIELSPDAVMVHIDGRFVYVNPAGLKLFGAETAEDLLGTDVLERVHPSFRPAVVARQQLMYRDGESVPIVEEIFLRLDGTTVDVEVTAAAIPLQGRRAIQVIARDITLRKQAELEIRKQREALDATNRELTARQARSEAEVAQRTRELQSEKLFIERIINNAPTAIAFTDRNRLLRWFNPEFAHLTGFDANEIYEKPIFELWPEAKDDMARMLDHMFKSGEVTRINALPFHKDASETASSYWDLTLVPVMDADGFVDGVVSITVDVTSRIEAERAHRGRLEAIREMDRLKDDFINTVTHELRTPLTAIMGYCEFLEDHIGGDLTSDQEEYVRQIKEGGDRLKRLVDDLLDFARLEAGTFMLTRREADLAELVREEVEALLPDAQDSGHQVHIELPDVLVARFDPDRVGQVLRNLVGNAIKFTPAGGHLYVRLLSEDGHARLEVEDNGPGIAPQLQSRVFDKFFQAEPSLTRLHGGAGLGLAIAKALVEAQGGCIGFHSAPGSGSVFWFLLPLHPVEEDAA